MTIIQSQKSDRTSVNSAEISCDSCAAKCCQLEVLLIGDTKVPPRFVSIDQWGGEVMNRLDDGWCAALDRQTHRCSIYENRPQICRDFELGSSECLKERAG